MSDAVYALVGTLVGRVASPLSTAYLESKRRQYALRDRTRTERQTAYQETLGSVVLAIRAEDEGHGPDPVTGQLDREAREAVKALSTATTRLMLVAPIHVQEIFDGITAVCIDALNTPQSVRPDHTINDEMQALRHAMQEDLTKLNT